VRESGTHGGTVSDDEATVAKKIPERAPSERHGTDKAASSSSSTLENRDHLRADKNKEKGRDKRTRSGQHGEESEIEEDEEDVQASIARTASTSPESSSSSSLSQRSNAKKKRKVRKHGFSTPQGGGSSENENVEEKDVVQDAQPNRGKKKTNVRQHGFESLFEEEPLAATEDSDEVPYESEVPDEWKRDWKTFLRENTTNSGDEKKEATSELVEEIPRYGGLESMLIVPKLRLLMCRIDKNANTNMALLFNRLNEVESPYDLGASQPEELGYSTTDLNAIMKNSSWRKAVFLRDPLERLLSAYISKCVNHEDSPCIEYKTYHPTPGCMESNPGLTVPNGNCENFEDLYYIQNPVPFGTFLQKLRVSLWRLEMGHYEVQKES